MQKQSGTEEFETKVKAKLALEIELSLNNLILNWTYVHGAFRQAALLTLLIFNFDSKPNSFYLSSEVWSQTYFNTGF